MKKIFRFLSFGVEYEIFTNMPFWKAWVRGWREHKRGEVTE